MSRPRRAFVPGGIYHVTARGSDRHAIFRCDADRAAFLARLHSVVSRYALRCLGYCLMTNHYHGLYQTLDGRISDALRSQPSSTRHSSRRCSAALGRRRRSGTAASSPLAPPHDGAP